MPVPDFQSLMIPVLKAFADGEAPLSEVRERTAAAERLSSEDLREMLPSGRQTTFANRVAWATTHMERAGLLERVRRGTYRLTQDRESLLSRKPPCIDMYLLRRLGLKEGRPTKKALERGGSQELAWRTLCWNRPSIRAGMRRVIDGATVPT